MRWTPWILTLLLGFAQALQAQTAPASAPVKPPDPPANSMPRDVLEGLDKTELGAKYNPADAERIYQTHLWLEKYFQAESGEDRKAIAAIIQNIGLDPNIVGRLCRIRMTWQELEPGTYHIFARVGPHDLHYFLGIPKGYDRMKAWPLLIKMPAFNAFPLDHVATPDDVVRCYMQWMDEELSAHPDNVVIMPLLSLTDLYGPDSAGMNNVIQPMLHVANICNIDPARVYLIGHDMAAHAAWNLALNYTTYFASFEALAGGATEDWQKVRLANLRNLLTVAWHDADDAVVRVDLTRSLVKVLKGLKYDVDFDESKGVGHAPGADIAERCYQKMHARTRDLYPREEVLQSTRPEPIFNRLDWVQVWQPMSGSAMKRLYFRAEPSTMNVFESAMRIVATCQDNNITARVDNVESMRFFLNDQMVDFSKPVTVTIGNKDRFKGMVKPDMQEMLADQIFLGRGWRYFTGVIDIDFGDTAEDHAHVATTRSTTQSAEDAARKRKELMEKAKEYKKELQNLNN